MCRDLYIPLLPHKKLKTYVKLDGKTVCMTSEYKSTVKSMVSFWIVWAPVLERGCYGRNSALTCLHEYRVMHAPRLPVRRMNVINIHYYVHNAHSVVLKDTSLV